MIRLGFIGVGGYGRIQLEGFLSLQEGGLTEICAVADPSEESLELLNELPALAGARRYGSYEAMFDGEELEAVVICAPIPLHYEITLAALAQGLVILLEKPPVNCLSEWEKLCAADTNGRVMVGFQHIYSDLVRGLKRELAEGGMGRILTIQAWGLWPRGAGYYHRSSWTGRVFWHGRPVLDGPCTNAMSHYVNLMFYLAGEDEDSFGMPQEVTGEAYRARNDLDTYDTGCLKGITTGQTRFFAGFSHATPEEVPVRIIIQGERGERTLCSNATRLLRPEGTECETGEGSAGMRRDFLLFAEGDRSRNKTPLHAMQPYVTATNLMFQSSGGIHDIPEEFMTIVDVGPHQRVCAVSGLPHLIKNCAGKIELFSKTDIPWARKTHPLNTAVFSEERMLRLLSSADRLETVS